MTRTVLIVDDDPVQRRLVEAAVTRAGHKALLADGGEAALKLATSGVAIDVVILDLVMPGMDGNAVLAALREAGFLAPVIVQTAQGSIDTVVTAMRAGAFDFVVKPASPDRLTKAISDALTVEARRAETDKNENGARQPRKLKQNAGTGLNEIATTSPAMRKVLNLAQRAAASDIPMLIEGESGVGKEYIARAVQGAGGRRSKPFVTVNCGAIPDNLVESILFGHEKGAFTGATEKHAGKFVEAHGGTLFLDEIGDLPLDVQVKLLRAVQDGEVDPVGGKTTVKVDIRLISATHRDLLQQVKLGKFREDLFYRLNVYPIVVPPLRDRRGDIPALVNQFVARFGRSGPVPVKGISTSALAMLKSFDWPGNIRQLENAVFRACVLAESEFLTEDEFPQVQTMLSGDLNAYDQNAEIEEHYQIDSAGLQSGLEEPVRLDPKFAKQVQTLDARGDIRALAEVELDMIKFAIDLYDGQMSEVARRLGIGRSTLYRKLKEYGLDGGIDGPAEGDQRAAG
jgi:DNA-binding NtrC family response regulator